MLQLRSVFSVHLLDRGRAQSVPSRRHGAHFRFGGGWRRSESVRSRRRRHHDDAQDAQRAQVRGVDCGVLLREPKLDSCFWFTQDVVTLKGVRWGGCFQGCVVWYQRSASLLTVINEFLIEFSSLYGTLQ